jgi:hypothetical protein
VSAAALADPVAVVTELAAEEASELGNAGLWLGKLCELELSELEQAASEIKSPTA